MKVKIQPATEKDFLFTENLSREAFWNLYRPGSVEHLILHNLRNSNNYIRELDLIAVNGNEIVGHIISSKAKVVDNLTHEHEILCIGPFSVSPDDQRHGIGSILMNESIRIAKELGFTCMILFGNPGYYHRFGFVNAKEYSISTKEGQNFEPFMALELQNNGLSNIKGRFYEDTAFEIQQDELIEFEKKFPYKVKMKTDTQFEH